MGGERKHAGVVLATQIGLVAVNVEVVAVCLEIAKAECRGYRVHPVDGCRKNVEVGMKLAPHFHVVIDG